MQAVAGVVVQQQCFGSVDGRVQLWTGIQVLPVQVHTPGVSPAKTVSSVATKIPLCCVAREARVVECFSPVVATYNPVWVEHRNELEDKRVSQDVRTRVISSQDQVKEPVEHEG